MSDAPKPSSLTNVFGLDNPQHLLTKMYVELQHFMESCSVWTENKPYPEPLFIAFDLALTVWHMTDWLWMSSLETRLKLAKKYDIAYNETPTGIGSGLERFQEAIAKDCRALYIAREIANASKHMRRKKHDEKIQAVVEWCPAVQAGGLAQIGDLVMSVSVVDDGKKQDAAKWFIDAIGYWEKLCTDEGLLSKDALLPQKIIKKQRTTMAMPSS